jgi:hypothetical protein
MSKALFFKAVRPPTEDPPAYLVELLQTVREHARKSAANANRPPTLSRQTRSKYFAGGDYGRATPRRRA